MSPLQCHISLLHSFHLFHSSVPVKRVQQIYIFSVAVPNVTRFRNSVSVLFSSILLTLLLLASFFNRDKKTLLHLSFTAPPLFNMHRKPLFMCDKLVRNGAGQCRENRVLACFFCLDYLPAAVSVSFQWPDCHDSRNYDSIYYYGHFMFDVLCYFSGFFFCPFVLLRSIVNKACSNHLSSFPS